MLHSVELVVFRGLIDTTRVVMRCGLSSDEDLRLTCLTTLLTIVVFIRVCPFQLVLRAFVERALVFELTLGKLGMRNFHIRDIRCVGLRISPERLRDNRTLFATCPDAHHLIAMSAENLLPKFVLAVRAELFRGDLISESHTVLLFMLPPDRLLV